MMSFAVGSLVRARGREWVVLPESEEQLLILRPLGGTDEEVTGIYLPLETIEPASFGLPDPSMPGDYRSCKLLRDAVRLGFRSSAGPFRCFARIGVEPRPYQVDPLLMALKLDPIRLLIEDDVGIGKAIEACRTRPDFVYGQFQKAVYIDGPHHEFPERRARDHAQTDAMEDLGYTVIRFPDKEDWDVKITQYPHIFGREQ